MWELTVVVFFTFLFPSILAATVIVTLIAIDEAIARRGRFSLRSLLIAMTVVAVAMGIVVAAN